MVWSYPRGGNLSRKGETGIDVTAYAAHLAAQIGANVIKVKPPTAHVEQPEAAQVYENEGIDISSLRARVAHVMQSAFAGRRLVVFSGGAAKKLDDIYAEIGEVAAGGGSGSIIGRNTFQRQRDDACDMLDRIIGIYRAAR